MPDLTLEQVRKAGRRAWVENGDVAIEYIPNIDTWAVQWQRIRTAAGGDGLPDLLPASGWRHPSGCDCKVCKP